jgi:plastocyanin
MLKASIVAAAGAATAMLIAALAAGPASAGGGCHRGDSRDERGTTVTMSENCFAASVLRIETGDTVTWFNEDEGEHTVTGADQRWGDYEPIFEGEEVSYAFAESGIFLYYCQLHSGMVGAIVVGDGQRVSNESDESAQSVSAVSAGNGSSAEPDETAAASVSAEDGGPGLGRTLAIVGGGIAALGVVALALTRVRRPRDA